MREDQSLHLKRTEFKLKGPNQGVRGGGRAFKEEYLRASEREKQESYEKLRT